MYINSELEEVQIIGEKKGFCRRKTPQSKKKETVGIGVFIISKNHDRKTMQPIRRTSGPHAKIKMSNHFGRFRLIPIEKTYTSYI